LRSRLILFLLLAVFAVSAQAENLFVVFTDPAGDSQGPVDVVGVGLSFDKTTGAYTLILLADSSGPFQGNFRVNINLYNPDTGTTDCDPSFFHDTLNDYIGFPSDTILVLYGVNSNLRAWDVGDRVATNSTPFGNPDCTSLFHSAVADLDAPFQRDLIADGDAFAEIFAGPVIFVDGFESGDPSAWSDFVPPLGVPIADFTWLVVGLQVQFHNQSSGDQPLYYLWEFGDGNVSYEINPTHTYAAAGTYNVTLTAINQLGTDSVVKAVDYVPPQGVPIADFRFSMNGLQVYFENTSTGDPFPQFNWEFGDGTTSSEESPTHIYATSGTYTVKLTATNTLGTDTTTQNITVSP